MQKQKVLISNRTAVKILAICTGLFCIVGTLFIFSPFYIPQNYQKASGQLGYVDSSNGGRDNNNYILFHTQTGQPIVYKYQPLLPFHHFGSTIELYYNQNNPKQVKIRPSSDELIAELALIDLGGPFVLLLLVLGSRQTVKSK